MGTGIATLDNLALLLGGKGPNDQQTPFGMPTPRGIMTNTQPAALPPGQPPAQPMTRPNLVSDDPSITQPAPAPAAAQPAAPQPVAPPQQFPVPTTPTFQNPDVAGMKALQDKITAASQPVTRADHPASIWQKILSPVLGGLVAGTSTVGEGTAAGKGLLSKNYDRAVDAQKQQLDPLYKQMELQEKMLPFNKEANTNSQNTYEDNLHSHDAFQRQQEADDTQSTRAPEIRKDPDGTEHFFYKTRGGKEFEGPAPAGYVNSQTRKTEDQNTPAVGARPEKDPDSKSGALRIRTKDGGFMPYQAKTIDEGALEGDPRAKALYDEAHRDKSQETKPATPAQYAKVQGDRDKGWNVAHKEYAKAVEALSPKDTEGLQQARQDFYDQRQQVQDEYEDQIGTLGGTAKHTDLPRNIFGEDQAGAAPTAAPAAGASPAASAPKAVTKDVVQKYADTHKMTFAQAQQGFQAKGYKIQ